MYYAVRCNQWFFQLLIRNDEIYLHLPNMLSSEEGLTLDDVCQVLHPSEIIVLKERLKETPYFKFEFFERLATTPRFYVFLTTLWIIKQGPYYLYRMVEELRHGNETILAELCPKKGYFTLHDLYYLEKSEKKTD